jgi:hypothetical protein
LRGVHAGGAIEIDGQFLLLALKEEPSGVQHRIQVEMPSGNVLGPVGDSDRKAQQPKAHYRLDSNDLYPNAYTLSRAEDGAKLVTLGIDSLGQIGARFDPSENRVAWGSADGTVFLCDIAKVRGRLASLGLGW